MHSGSPPSAWITRFAPLIPRGGTVLDVACGTGRHARLLQSLGLQVTGMDRDAAAINGLRRETQGEWIVADIENGPWPLSHQRFDAVVVTNYLWRPLWPHILNSVAPGGLLLYETFAVGNEAFGKPSRADFLLQPGELLQVCAGWHIVAFEQGRLTAPDRVAQRIAARKQSADGGDGQTPASHLHPA